MPRGPRIDLLGLPVHAVDLDSLFHTVDEMVASGGRFTVTYANVHTVNQALDLPDVAEFVRSVDLVYCDGEGVRLGARALGHRLPPRMTGADWIWDLAGHAAKRGHRIYWVGARPGVAERACQKLTEAAPGLEIVGTHDGYFDHSAAGSAPVISAINRARPDILIVGFGTPLQERWISQVRGRIHAPVVWAVGATADFVSGETRRGPTILHQHGFEWLARLTVEPQRLWKRYLIGNMRYLARVARARTRDL